MFKKIESDYPKKVGHKDSKDSKNLPKESIEVEEYVRQDVFNEYRKGMDARCTTHEKQISVVETRQKAIDQKISATLIFVIATLVAILSAMCTGLLH